MQNDQDATIVEEVEGDLFDAPENAVLIHACNCIGHWGAGIAKAFKTKYPAAFAVQAKHCRDKLDEGVDVCGTCLLIPPQGDDYAVLDSKEGSTRRSRRHWIACLFTSRGYGKMTKTKAGVDPPEMILASTRLALRDLRGQLEGRDGQELESGPGELWSCRFNSGFFGVEWRDSRRVVEEVFEGFEGRIRVVRPVGG